MTNMPEHDAPYADQQKPDTRVRIHKPSAKIKIISVYVTLLKHCLLRYDSLDQTWVRRRSDGFKINLQLLQVPIAMFGLVDAAPIHVLSATSSLMWSSRITTECLKYVAFCGHKQAFQIDELILRIHDVCSLLSIASRHFQLVRILVFNWLMSTLSFSY